MSFRPEPDTSVADWWLEQGRASDWGDLVTHGPPGYAAYVRFRHHEENEGLGRWVLRLVTDVLARHTSTPEDVVVAQWEGITDGPTGLVTAWHDDVPHAERTSRPTEPARTFLFSDEVMALPRAPLFPHHGGGSVRSYLLLRGPVDRLGDWPKGRVEAPFDEPHELVCGAMWPEDRAWFYAWEVDDREAATIACDEDLAAELLADGRYAAWRVERGDPDPPDRLRRD